jgi:hypothetical protein
MENSRVNPLVLFRQSATSMSAGVALLSTGILLVAKGTASQLPVIGLAFCVLSVIFLISALVQLFWPKISNLVVELGDSLTALFLLINIISIIQNWSKIMDQSMT